MKRLVKHTVVSLAALVVVLCEVEQAEAVPAYNFTQIVSRGQDVCQALITSAYSLAPVAIHSTKSKIKASFSMYNLHGSIKESLYHSKYLQSKYSM